MPNVAQIQICLHSHLEQSKRDSHKVHLIAAICEPEYGKIYDRLFYSITRSIHTFQASGYSILFQYAIQPNLTSLGKGFSIVIRFTS